MLHGADRTCIFLFAAEHVVSGVSGYWNILFLANVLNRVALVYLHSILTDILASFQYAIINDNYEIACLAFLKDSLSSIVLFEL